MKITFSQKNIRLLNPISVYSHCIMLLKIFLWTLDCDQNMTFYLGHNNIILQNKIGGEYPVELTEQLN